MTSLVCLDASIALKLVLSEEDSSLAKALWQSCLKEGIQPVAPQLFHFEITAVLRKQVHRGVITAEYGALALQYLLKLDVQLRTIPNLHLTAWQLAGELNRPTAYDTHYIALAAQLGCDFWTADRRLFNASHQTMPFVRWLGEFTA